MRTANTIILLIIANFIILSCVNQEGVDKTLSLAGDNRTELEQVLAHYKNRGERKKYRAACYLIDNMKYHGSYGKIEYLDNRIDSLAREADTAYYSDVKGLSHKEILPVHPHLQCGCFEYQHLQCAYIIQFEPT